MKINQLGVEDLFIIIALDEGRIDVLDAYDSNNNDERVMLRYQFLHRKNFLQIDDDGDGVIYGLTEKARKFLYMLKRDYKEIGKEVNLDGSEIDRQFEVLWARYPHTSKNEKFPHSLKHFRVLRDTKPKARINFEKVLREGKYTLDDILVALEYEVRIRMAKTKENDMEFMPAITTWLNQQKFVGWFEELKSNPTSDEGSQFETIV